jgi:hypothetical protein
VGVDDVRQGRSVQSKENGTKDRSLGDPKGQFDRWRLNTIDEDRLKSVGKVGSEPGEDSVINAKRVLQSGEENGVVNSVESC